MDLFLEAVVAESSVELLDESADDAVFVHSSVGLFGGTVDVEVEGVAVSASKQAVEVVPSSSD